MGVQSMLNVEDRAKLLLSVNGKSYMLRRLIKQRTRFRENRLKTFPVILLTDKQTDTTEESIIRLRYKILAIYFNLVGYVVSV